MATRRVANTLTARDPELETFWSANSRRGDQTAEPAFRGHHRQLAYTVRPFLLSHPDTGLLWGQPASGDLGKPSGLAGGSQEYN